MSLEVIFGKNKTGKTVYINNMYSSKDSSVLFIEAEIDFDDVLKGNLGGTGKNAIFSPHKKIIDFLNSIVGKSFKVKAIDDEEYKKFVQSKNDIDLFSQKLTETDDDFFEDCFKNSFKTCNLEGEFEYKFDLIEFSSEKRNGSSGSLSYSLIKLLYEMILDDKIKIEGNFTLVIDEIEKFLHPELIFKIANMIVKVSEKLNVVVTTHSPLFLERIFYIHKNRIVNKKDCDIKYSLKYSSDIKNSDNKEIFTFDTNEITKILKEKNYRTISNLSHFLFSSKCFFVEGLIDNSIINDIICINNIDKPYTIIDCNGKGQVKVMLEIIRSLSIIPYYHVCLFYDSDSNKNGEKILINDSEKNNVCSIVNDPDIEEQMFDVIKDKKDPTKTTYIITRNGNIAVKYFKKETIGEKENGHFIFTTNWIKENSTKPENEKNTRINELVKQVSDFMMKK